MPFRKIDPCIWGDAKFRQLSEDAKLVWFYLLTNHHLKSIPGVFQAWPETMARDMGWGEDPHNFRFETAFKEITDPKMATYDDTAGLIYIPKAFFFNLPDNLNVVKGWAIWFKELPECPLKDRILNDFKNNLERYRKGYSKPFAEPFTQPLHKRYAKQSRQGIATEKEKEQEKEKEKEREFEGEPNSQRKPSGRAVGQDLPPSRLAQEQDLAHLSKTDPAKFAESLPEHLRGLYKKSKGIE